MYENSIFLQNRFTFCGVNTNFGQQWAPPAYYHLTPIVSKGKHCNKMADNNFTNALFTSVFYILNQISLMFVPRGITAKAALLPVMTSRHTGNKQLPEPLHWHI